jgi:hypothetical protein
MFIRYEDFLWSHVFFLQWPVMKSAILANHVGMSTMCASFGQTRRPTLAHNVRCCVCSASVVLVWRVDLQSWDFIFNLNLNNLNQVPHRSTITRSIAHQTRGHRRVGSCTCRDQCKRNGAH